MYINSTGLVCSVGLTAASSCAAMRAGIANFEELPYPDSRGEPIIGARVPELSTELTRAERLGQMLALAIADCLRDKNIESSEPLPLLLGLAERERPGGASDVAGEIISRVVEKLGIRFHPKYSHVLAEGHTAGFSGLKRGKEILRKYDIPMFLLCAVDSYLCEKSLLWLNSYQRLKTSENSDGVVPGEAAVAVLITQHGPVSPGGKLRILGLGFSRENATVLNDEPMLGVGLTAAVQHALDEAGLSYHEIGLRISDLTGESIGFREQSLVEGRLLRVTNKEMPIWHCADSLGDTGAAAGLVELAVAADAKSGNYAPPGPIVCLTGSTNGARSVVVLA